MQIVYQDIYSPCLMEWEENSHICLHMQLIAILSRIGVNRDKTSSLLGCYTEVQLTRCSLSYTKIHIMCLNIRYWFEKNLKEEDGAKTSKSLSPRLLVYSSTCLLVYLSITFSSSEKSSIRKSAEESSWSVPLPYVTPHVFVPAALPISMS